MTQTNRDEIIPEILAEFSHLIASARTRWVRFADEMHPELRGLGMMVLQMISRNGPITATELGTMLDMDKAAVSRQVTKLRELELVSAEPAAEDRRVVLLTLSSAGRETISELRRRNGDEYRLRFADWGEHELEQLQQLLRRFNASGQVEEATGPAERCARRHAAE